MLKEGMLFLAKQDSIREFAESNPLAQRVARRFVAGESLDAAMQATHALNKRHISVSVDHLGENTTDEREASAAANDYVGIIERIHQEGADANISVKLTALGLDISDQICRDNLTRVLRRAGEYGIFVRVDMEASEYTQRTVDLVAELHHTFDNVGTVMQSALYRTPDDVDRLLHERVRMRLVKGAYLEPSTVAYAHKADVDSAYMRLLWPLLERGVYPAFATHDERMIDAVIRIARERDIPRARFEFQMLYGIRRDLQERLAAAGYNVRVYLPYGSQWYPYLTRRMAERPANLMFVLGNTFRG
ncbi:MAG TPA: proline dehydrogenase family protein [Ktedonobacterales bacterium]|jgi:proline dehydrogenase|nr:proline dehydrogenase family protein [Ktedonobacterales bacterium]